MDDFLITRNDLSFVALRKHQNGGYVEYIRTDRLKKVISTINYFTPNRTSVPMTVKFDIQLGDGTLIITENAGSSYPEYDYTEWSHNGVYTLGSKEWESLSSYDAEFKNLTYD